MRAASLGAVAYSVLGPAWAASLIATSPQLSSHTVPAIVATTIYVPFYAHTVRRGLRASRPAALSAIAQAVVVIGATPIVGSIWLRTWGTVGASILIVLPLSWAVPAFLVLLGAATAWSMDLGAPGGASFEALVVWNVATIATVALTMFVLVWLVAALRRLRTARNALAEEAVDAQRQRLGVELSRTVGADLAVVVERGIRAGDLIGTDTQSAAAMLLELVEGSRRTLAAARRTIARYKAVSLRARLDTAIALLRAAGIEAEVDIDDDLPPVSDETVEASLRVLTTQLLRGRRPGSVLIRVVRDGGSARVECHAVDAQLPSPAGSSA